MGVVIKDSQAYPVAALYTLFTEVYGSAEGMSQSLAEKYPSRQVFEEDMRQLRSLPGAVALAAEKDGRLAAFLTIRPRRPWKLCHTADLVMGVVSSLRGQGIGRRILAEGLRRAMAAPELEIVYLMVRADNIPAVQLYTAMGFEKLAVLARDIKIGQDRFDGLLMRRFVDAGERLSALR